MASDNQFLTGVLEGLYQGGVGNPSVNEARKAREDQIRQQQTELNLKAGAQGMRPAQGFDHPGAHEAATNALSFMFPGSGGPSIKTAFEPDPKAMTYSQNPQGKVALEQGLPPSGSTRLDPSKGASLLASQNKAPLGGQSVSWETASPTDKALGEGLYKGQIQTAALSWKERSIGTRLAIEYAKANGLPPYVSYTGDTKAKMSSYMASGKGGQNALSLDTALKHLGTLSEKFDELKNFDENFMNVPINKLRKMTDDPNVIATLAAITAVQGELATAFKGSSGTDQEHQQWMQSISPNLTPAQQIGAITTVDELLRGRLSALQNQMGNVMDRPISGRQLLSPTSEKISGQIRSKAAPKAGPITKQFKNLLEATKANLPKGTRIMVGGRPATVQ